MNRYGIYFLLDGSDVVYIGQTENLEVRLKGHKDKKFTSHRFIECCVSMLNIYESRWLNMFKPKYNKTHKAFYNRGPAKNPERIYLNLSEEIYYMAKEASKRLGLTFNEYIEHLIKEACKKK